MTASELREYTCKDLAQMAKQAEVSGWHAMRKEELVKALVSVARAKKRRAAKRSSSSSRNSSSASRGASSRSKSKTGRSSSKSGRRAGHSSESKSRTASQSRANAAKRRTRTDKPVAKQSAAGRNGVPAPKSRQRAGQSRKSKKISAIHQQMARSKDIGTSDNGHTVTDRLVVMVRDPYWLHVYWELSTRSVERARAALAQRWHGARPILRLYTLDEEGNATPVRDIEIHGGVKHWYVDVQNPPQEYRIEIGYRTHEGELFVVARSNAVTTPPAGTSDAVDDNWADIAENADRIFAMSGGYSARGTSRELQELLEERLQRPMGSPMQTRFGTGASGRKRDDEFQFAVDAEVIIYGVSPRDSHVTLKGEPVQLREDGSFAVRMSMPDRRQVIPVVASSGDGVEQRTIVLAVERNTKVMEPIYRDGGQP